MDSDWMHYPNSVNTNQPASVSQEGPDLPTIFQILIPDSCQVFLEEI